MVRASDQGPLSYIHPTMAAVEEPDAGRRFGIHPQLSQQRCKRARYDANLLAKEFNKLGFSSTNSSEVTEEVSPQTCVTRRGESQVSDNTTLATTPIGALTSTQGEQAAGTGHSECPSRQVSLEFSCEAAGEQRSDSLVSQIVGCELDGEFDEELSYLAGQVQISGDGSPAQAMPYIF